VLLQHRARWSHHGGTWGTPGGALHHGEPPHEGALREAREELGLLPDDVVLGEQSVDDHGGWSYTTVLARPARRIEAADLRLDGESDGAAWVPLAGLDRVELHPGLAASLGRLRPLLETTCQ
jgi:8-oxo-dGTP pyrophosphatase MutT (NUDIX family)